MVETAFNSGGYRVVDTAFNSGGYICFLFLQYLTFVDKICLVILDEEFSR